MPRLRQVPRAEAAPSVVPLYDLLFGDRDPVAEPGTATGTPGDWWPVFALVPDVFDHSVMGFRLYQSSEASTRPAVARARPDARRVHVRESVRVLAALQVVSYGRYGGGEDRGDPALECRDLLLADRTRGARVRRRARRTTRAAFPTACSMRCAPASPTRRFSSSRT